MKGREVIRNCAFAVFASALLALQLAARPAVAGATDTGGDAAVAASLDEAIGLSAQGRLEACVDTLRQVEPQAWQATAALRNRWHRQVWQCDVRLHVDDPQRVAAWADWMGAWLERFEHEPDVDTRFRESTRVMQWVYMAAGGRAPGDVMDAFLLPRLEIVARQAPPRALPLGDELNQLLQVVVELGGHLPVERDLQRWRDLAARRLGEDHPLALMGDRSLAFTARKAGRGAEALALARRAWDRFERSAPALPTVRLGMSSELAAALQVNGRPSEALHFARLTQRILADIPGETGLRPGRAAYNTASIALELGDFELARDEARSSIRVFVDSGSYAVGEVEFPNQILQQARLELGEADAATALHQALAFSTPSSDWIGPAAQRLLAWTEANGDEAQLAEVRRFFDAHIALTKTVIHPDRTAHELLHGRMAAARGDMDAVLTAQSRALLQSHAGTHPEGRAATWLAWAREEARAGRRAFAIWCGKRAAAALLPALMTLSADQRAGWLDVRRQLLRDLQQTVLWLAEDARLPEAEALAAELQAGEIRHYLNRGGLRGPTLSQPAWSAQELAWSTAIDRLLSELDDALATDRRLPEDLQPWQTRTPASKASAQRRAALRDRFVAEITAWRTAARAAADTVRASARASDPVRAAATRTRTLPPRTARLWWAIGDERLSVIAQWTGGKVVRSVAVPRATLMRELLLAREEAIDDGRLRHAALTRLHEWLIAPVEADLRAEGIRHLILRPGTDQHALPFAALHDPRSARPYLVQRYTVRLQMRDDGTAGSGTVRSLRALGSTRGEGTADALPWVSDELDGVSRRGGIPHRTALDDRFDWQALEEALSRPAGAVHLATHFRLHPTLPQRSYLLLGDGRRADLERLATLPWHRGALVVASACDTGVGAGGLAVASLRHTLQQAGAGAVVGSLWAVQDESTAHLMPGLYGELRRLGWHTGGAAAQALSLAQRRWLQQHRGKAWAHPRHWAGFLWFD